MRIEKKYKALLKRRKTLYFRKIVCLLPVCNEIESKIFWNVEPIEQKAYLYESSWWNTSLLFPIVPRTPDIA